MKIVRKAPERPLGTCRGFDGRRDWLCKKPYDDRACAALEFRPLSSDDMAAFACDKKVHRALWRRTSLDCGSDSSAFLVSMSHGEGLCLYNAFASAHDFLAAAKRVYGDDLEKDVAPWGPFVATEMFAPQSGPARLVLDVEFYPNKGNGHKHGDVAATLLAARTQPDALLADIKLLLRRAFLALHRRVPRIAAAESHKPLGDGDKYEKISFHIAVPYVSARTVDDDTKRDEMLAWTNDQWTEFFEAVDDDDEAEYFAPAALRSVAHVRRFVERWQALLVAQGDAPLPHTGLSASLLWPAEAQRQLCATAEYQQVLDTSIYPVTASALKGLRTVCSGKAGERGRRRFAPLNVATHIGAQANALPRFTMTGWALRRAPVWLREEVCDDRSLRKRARSRTDDTEAGSSSRKRQRSAALLDNSDIVVAVEALLARRVPALAQDAVYRSSDGDDSSRFIQFDWAGHQPRPCGFERPSSQQAAASSAAKTIKARDEHRNNVNFWLRVNLCTRRVALGCYAERCRRKVLPLGYLQGGCSAPRAKQSLADAVASFNDEPAATTTDATNRIRSAADLARYDLIIVASKWQVLLANSSDARTAAQPLPPKVCAGVRRCAVVSTVRQSMSDEYARLRAALPPWATIDEFDQSILLSAAPPQASQQTSSQHLRAVQSGAERDAAGRMSDTNVGARVRDDRNEQPPVPTTAATITLTTLDDAAPVGATVWPNTICLAANYRYYSAGRVMSAKKEYARNAFAPLCANGVLCDRLHLAVGMPVVRLWPPTDLGRVGIVAQASANGDSVTVRFGDEQDAASTAIKPAYFRLHSGSGTSTYAMAQFPLLPLWPPRIALHTIERHIGRLRVAPALALRIDIPLDPFGWSAALLRRALVACGAASHDIASVVANSCVPTSSSTI